MNKITEKFKNRRSFFLVFLLIIASGSANKISHGAGVATIIGLLLFNRGYIPINKKTIKNTIPNFCCYQF